MSALIDNERTKLLANALDRASTACFTVGIATPVAGYIYGIVSFDKAIFPGWALVIFTGWLIAAVALHLLARLVLSRLKS